MSWLTKIIGLPGASRHPQAPWVLYKFTPCEGGMKIDLLCERCKGEYHWTCTSGPQGAQRHVVNFVMAHARCQ